MLNKYYLRGEKIEKSIFELPDTRKRLPRREIIFANQLAPNWGIVFSGQFLIKKNTSFDANLRLFFSTLYLVHTRIAIIITFRTINIFYISLTIRGKVVFICNILHKVPIYTLRITLFKTKLSLINLQYIQ